LEEDDQVMIDAYRFKANKAIDFAGWISAREYGVTATQVASGATPAGFRDLVVELRDPQPIEDNGYMRFGREQEAPISLWVKSGFEIMPNEWLIAHETDPKYLATPDGLSLDHSLISEIKTTGKDWNPENIPIRYRRQVQWQLHVTGAERCLFAWMLRAESFGVFVPGWIDPKHVWIDRDEEMIADLSAVADSIWEAVKGDA
jgi:hypothetical protein